ncbi:hypothetical protein C9J01_28845, partial [Photobacterium rosenbergii]
MKKTLIALSLASAISAPVMAIEAKTQGSSVEHGILTAQYHVIAAKITQISPDVGKAFSKYATGGSDQRAERREMAYEFMRDLSKQDAETQIAIKDAMGSMYIKSKSKNGDPIFGDYEAQDAFSSIVDDAAAVAAERGETTIEIGGKELKINEVRSALMKEKLSGDDYKKAIESNAKVISEIDEAIAAVNSDSEQSNGGKKPTPIKPDDKNGNGGSNLTPGQRNIVKVSDIMKLEKAGYKVDVDAKGNAQVLDKDGNVAG